MPKNKSKGSKAERELYQIFVENHYRAVRVAGSGTMENADCDIIAGKKGKGQKFAVEVKSCKKLPKYISKDQINRFMTFSEIFALNPVIAVRINQIGWIFLNPKEKNSLKDSGKNWAINNEIIRKKGKKFAQYFGGKMNKEKDKSLKVGSDILLNEKELDNLTSMDYFE